ncbi:MAG: acyl carrier protein [Planctomycetaceae bacterium]|nr:acyl carrier protein [Planctomycetaceae bacterium]
MIDQSSFSRTEATRQILQFLHEELLNGSGPVTLQADTDLLASGTVDSLGVMRLVAFLEAAFAVTIAHEDVTMENFLNASAIAALICERQEGAL